MELNTNINEKKKYFLKNINFDGKKTLEKPKYSVFVKVLFIFQLDRNMLCG